jgi:hypothetical protein
LRFKDFDSYSFPKSEIRAATEVAPQHSINVFGGYSFHGLMHQQCRDLLSLIVRKLKSQYRWFRARRQMQRDHAYRFLTRR